MARINLYNYQEEEIFYKKLRVYFLIVIAVILAFLINLFIYLFLQIMINAKETRNSFLITHINLVNDELKPIRDFNDRLNKLKRKIQVINQIESTRGSLLAFFQELDRITPKEIYFSNLKLNESQLELNGTSASPLYVADFLDKLNAKDGIFYSPILKSNSTNDGNVYDFTVSAYVKPNLIAKVLPTTK